MAPKWSGKMQPRGKGWDLSLGVQSGGKYRPVVKAGRLDASRYRLFKK